MSDPTPETSLTEENNLRSDPPPEPIDPDREGDHTDDIAEQIEQGWPGEPTTS